MLCYIFFTAFCILVAMAIFTTESLKRGLEETGSYGYSYILGWVASVLSFFLCIAAGLFLRSPHYEQ